MLSILRISLLTFSVCFCTFVFVQAPIHGVPQNILLSLGVFNFDTFSTTEIVGVLGSSGHDGILPCSVKKFIRVAILICPQSIVTGGLLFTIISAASLVIFTNVGFRP